MTGEPDNGATRRGLREIANSGQPEGGGFAYDEATLRDLVAKWGALADSYRESLTMATLGTAEGPGLDFASKAQVDAANSSGQAYIAYLAQNREYCLRQAHLLQLTLNGYLGVENHAVTTFDKDARR